MAFYDTLGEWSTLSAIEHIADMGKSVVVFVPVPSFSWRTTIYSTYANAVRLGERKFEIALMRRVLGHRNDGLHVEDTSTGEVSKYLGFESLVAVQYNVSSDALYGPLRESGLRVHVVGGCPRAANRPGSGVRRP